MTIRIRRFLFGVLVAYLMLFIPSFLYGESLIQFEPQEWDLGEVSAGETYTRVISIKVDSSQINKGIEITNVRPSCECLKTRVVSKTVNSKSDGVISATLHIDNTLNAYFRVFFSVHTNDPKNQMTRFYITGRVKGKGLSDSEIVVFRTKTTNSYEQIHQQVEKLRAKNQALVIKEYITDNLDTSRLRAQFEKQYSLNRYADVEMFTGKSAFIGNNEITKEFERLLSEAVIQPVELTHPLTPLDRGDKLNTLEILYFYSISCPGCREIKDDLFPRLRQKYKDQIVIREIDISDIDNYKYLMAVEEKYRLKSDASASIFIGVYALLGSREILNKTDETISKTLTESRETITDKQAPLKPASNEKIKERFLSFKVGTVITAGLLDGINPCAFATIIFLISFLTFIGKNRREIIITGLFYTLAVFVTYLLLGIGIFKAFQTLSAYGVIAKIVLYLTATFVFCLAGLSIYDLIIYLKSKKTGGITLQLPLSLKQRIHSVIRENVKPGRLVISAMVIGFLVTLFEAACTGQVYLPTIVFMLKDTELKLNAWLYLVLYNLMFIIPLVVIFILAYTGVKSQRLVELSQKNIVLSKILISIFFIGLGVLLLMS